MLHKLYGELKSLIFDRKAIGHNEIETQPSNGICLRPWRQHSIRDVTPPWFYTTLVSRAFFLNLSYFILYFVSPFILVYFIFIPYLFHFGFVFEFYRRNTNCSIAVIYCMHILYEWMAIMMSKPMVLFWLS